MIDKKSRFDFKSVISTWLQRNVGKLQLTFVTGMWRKSKRFVTANFGGIFSEREREKGEREERERSLDITTLILTGFVQREYYGSISIGTITCLQQMVTICIIGTISTLDLCLLWTGFWIQLIENSQLLTVAPLVYHCWHWLVI